METLGPLKEVFRCIYIYIKGMNQVGKIMGLGFGGYRGCKV